MKRSSSLPEHRKYSNGSELPLPRITKNPWLTKSSTVSDYKYQKGEKYMPKNYTIMNKDKLNNIENNYYEMRYFLNDKINRLEKNQRQINHILQYSLEQNRLQNDINAYNYDKYMEQAEKIRRTREAQYQKDKNYIEREYLIKMLREMPKIIDSKIDRILSDEHDINKNQQKFIENLEEKMLKKMKEQRMYDYIKYKKQINELRKLKDLEEQEKLRLKNEIEQQRIKYKLKSLKFQNQFNPFPPYGPFPFSPFNLFNNYNNPYAFGSSIDEFMKLILFKDMIGKYKMYDDYYNELGNMNPIYSSNDKQYNSDILEDYLRYKKLKKEKSTFLSNNSSIFSDYKKCASSKNYSKNNIPFINSGKYYLKSKPINKKLAERFMTSHNETNKTTKKSEKDKKSKESKSKSNKDKNSEKNKNGKEKSISESKNESGCGSESESEENKTKDKEGKKDEDKKDEDKNEDKKDDEDKDEAKKDETKKDDKKKEKEEEEEDEDGDEESDEDSKEGSKKKSTKDNKSKNKTNETGQDQSKANQNQNQSSQSQPNQTTSQQQNQTMGQQSNPQSNAQPNSQSIQQANQQPQ